MADLNFPLDTDLTTAVEDFELESSWQHAAVRAWPKASSVTAWKYGEWLVLNASGELEKANDTTSVRSSFCCVTKAEAYEVNASGKLDVIHGFHIAKSTNYKSEDSFAVGDLLVIKGVTVNSVVYGQLHIATTGEIEDGLVVGMALGAISGTQLHYQAL